MKSIVFRALGAAAVAVCLSGNVYAQASDTAPAEASASAAMKADSKADAKAAAKAERKANRKLGYAVRKAISKQSGVDVSNLVVRTKGGAVSLQGTMPDASQIDKAVDAAKTVPGVTSVANHLSIQQPN